MPLKVGLIGALVSLKRIPSSTGDARQVPPFTLHRQVCLERMILGVPRLQDKPTDTWQCLETFFVVATCWKFLTGIQWVDARDSAKYSIIHRTAPTSKNYIPPNVNSAEVENHQLGIFWGGRYGSIVVRQSPHGSRYPWFVYIDTVRSWLYLKISAKWNSPFYKRIALHS